MSKKWVSIFIFTALLGACSFAPLTPRTDAASVGKGNVKIQTSLSPVLAAGVTYGLGENVDVGLEIEQAGLGTAWARYSLINNPEGFSLATNAAVFLANGEYRSNGWYAGFLLSDQFTPKLRWNAGIRYAVLDYEFGVDDDGLFELLDFDNATDASHNGQSELSLSWAWRRNREVSLGVICQHLFKNTDPDNPDGVCLPYLGFVNRY